jgi:hypothetical protein
MLLNAFYLLKWDGRLINSTKLTGKTCISVFSPNRMAFERGCQSNTQIFVQLESNPTDGLVRMTVDVQAVSKSRREQNISANAQTRDGDNCWRRIPMT